jgi:hypothetical protein
MKEFSILVRRDLIRLAKYHYITIITGLAFFFALMIGLTNLFPPMIYIYFSVFVIPVISFSINLIVEEQDTFKENTAWPLLRTLSKICSATIIQLIPIIIYLIVLLFVLNYQFNVVLFILVYLLASAMHIFIGLSLSIIAKTPFVVSLSYGVYLIVFSIIPIFYSVGMMPDNFIYLMIISPAYLSGVLFEEIIHPTNQFGFFFPFISVVLQIIYMAVLYRFVIKPFIKHYIKLTQSKSKKMSNLHF